MAPIDEAVMEYMTGSARGCELNGVGWGDGRTADHLVDTPDVAGAGKVPVGKPSPEPVAAHHGSVSTGLCETT